MTPTARAWAGAALHDGHVVPGAADGRLDAESISGDVRLELVGAVNAEFDISSFNGEIRNCFGPKAVSTSEYAPGKELRFREGQGTAHVRIKTMNGDISVCRK